MARRNNDLYDGNAVRKIQPVRREQNRKNQTTNKAPDNLIKITEKQLRKARRQNFSVVKAWARISAIVAIFSLTAFLVYGQVRLTELTDDINTAQQDINLLKSEEVQLQMQVANGIDSTEVEFYARNQLGMDNVNSNQIIYINLEDENKGVVHNEDEGNLLLAIVNFFGF